MNELHSVHRGSIAPGIELTCIQTDRFKTGCLSVNLVGKLSRATAPGFALIPRVLRRGSSEHPDMESIAAALDELYGARIEPMVRKKGEMHCIGFYADYPDERFIPGGSDILEKVAGLVCGMLLSPDMRDGALRQDYIDSEKNNLIDDIRANINDKRGYSIDRLVEEMCANEAFGTCRLGDEPGVRAITPDTLTGCYHDILESSRVEILYCGSAGPDRVNAALSGALSVLPAARDDLALPPTEIVLYPGSGAPRRITEALDVTQGKLAVGFRLGKAMAGVPDYPALMVFNAVYGSGDISKLFLNVRERLALCYYVSSILEKHKGVMIVSSGVEFSDFETALDEILAQLGHVKSGDISEHELLSAKRSIITSIKSAMDRPAGLVDLYFDSAIASVRYDPAALCDEIEAVTQKQVAGTASQVEPDTIYFLTGDPLTVGEDGE